MLDDPNVRHELGADEGDDPQSVQMRQMEIENDHAILHLNQFGYNGRHLEAKLIERETSVRAKLTQPNSAERIQILSECTTHGSRFLVTGGYNLTSDDGLKAAEMANRKRKLAEAKSDRRKRKAFEKREKEAQEVLSQNKEIDKLNAGDLKKLLTWYKVPAKDIGPIQQRRTMWKKIMDEKEKEPSYEKWTDEDEAALVALTATDFDLKETQLGRLEAQRKREFEGTIKRMSRDGALKYIEGLFGVDNNVENTAEV